METETKQQKTEILTEMDTILFAQLSSRLKAQDFSFEDWLDKITRQYLHLPPRFSYDKKLDQPTDSEIELTNG